MLYFIRVDDDLRVQITDNALARDLFPQDYHCLGDNENRPIKWLAIESLLNKAFSTASDVVSKSTFFANFLSTQEPKSQEVFITFAYAYNKSKSIKRELIVFRCIGHPEAYILFTLENFLHFEKRSRKINNTIT